MQDDAGAYAGYERWKTWTSPFTFDADKAGYFAGEMQGVPVRGARILELGFGSGDFLAWARSEGAIVAGTEVNAVLLAAAKQHDFESLPAAIETIAGAHAARFDAIVAFDVFEHLDTSEVRTALWACAIMLKPGGRLLLRFPNAQSPFGLASQHGDVTHKTALSRSVIEQMMDPRLFAITRYSTPFRFLGSGIKQRLLRRLRGLAQDALGGVLNAVYAQDIPWGPVVTLVLTRSSAAAGV